LRKARWHDNIDKFKRCIWLGLNIHAALGHRKAKPSLLVWFIFCQQTHAKVMMFVAVVETWPMRTVHFQMLYMMASSLLIILLVKVVIEQIADYGKVVVFYL